MAKWDISKDFHLEYGHRVWSQELDSSLCAVGDDKCACRHLHGHSGKVTLHLQGDTLERGMVTDFKHTGFLKDFIDNTLDHKFIIDVNDPGFRNIVGCDYSWLVSAELLLPIKIGNMVAGQVVDLYTIEQKDGPLRELLEGFFFVDFLPTSENLAKYMFDVASARIGNMVAGVDWQETAKSIARYRRD